MTFFEKLMEHLFFCPECRSEMEAVHRTQENGSVFVWFKCRKPNCKGQWLHKMPVPQDRVRVAG